MSEKFLPDEWDRAYAAGLDAAREAVAALEGNLDLEIDWDRDHAADPSGNTRNARIWLRDAVAAIDALRQPPPLTAHYDPAAKDNRP